MWRVRPRVISNFDTHHQAPSQILSVSGLGSLAAPDGYAVQCRPIGVEDLDEAVWTQIKQLLEIPS